MRLYRLLQCSVSPFYLHQPRFTDLIIPFPLSIYHKNTEHRNRPILKAGKSAAYMTSRQFGNPFLKCYAEKTVFEDKDIKYRFRPDTKEDNNGTDSSAYPE